MLQNSSTTCTSKTSKAGSKIDWRKLWKEFNDHFGYGQGAIFEEEKRLIKRIVEKQLKSKF